MKNEFVHVPSSRYLLFSYSDYYPGGGMTDLARVFDTKEEVEKFLLMDFDLTDSRSVPGKDVRYEWDIVRSSLRSADEVQIYDHQTGVWLTTYPVHGWMGREEEWIYDHQTGEWTGSEYENDEEDLPEEEFLRKWVSQVMQELQSS